MSTPSSYTGILPAGGDTATPRNLQKRLRVIKRYSAIAGRRVLDCGCGSGDYVLALATMGADAWGIEFSAEKVRSARPDVAGRVSVGDLANIAMPAASVDVALLNEVLEHVPDDRRVLREVYRVLKPGGTLIVFSPNRRYPFETHGATLKASGRRVPHYTPLVPYVPLAVATTVLEFWARNYWPGELRQMVSESGYTVEHKDYVWQTFENISGHRPTAIARSARLFRLLSDALERVPLIRSLGVSQVVVAAKPR
jgi:ubiquinone/menaquinone biosynthesis C-methylase UbiE